MKRCAVFTVVQNDAEFLKLWLSYYTLHFDLSDIYVLDHQSDGDAVDTITDACLNHGVNYLQVSHDYSYDGNWLAILTRAFQTFLLMSYKATLFAAADEIVTPMGDDWSAHLDQFDKLQQGLEIATAYDVIHRKDEEPALDWSAPVLSQRAKWVRSGWYSKPVLSKYPLFWQQGWRMASNVPPNKEPDPTLTLVHLHRVDYDHCLRSHRERAARMWEPESRKHGVFRHNLIEDAEQLSRWMLSNPDASNEYATLLDIPAAYKEII